MRVNPLLAKYIIGLDLGQVQDSSALGIMEREWIILHPGGEYILEELDPSRATLEYRLSDLVRWPLGTPYPEIVEQVVAVMADQRIFAYGGMLVVDVGNVGRAVLDMLRAAGVRAMMGVNITSGFAETASATDQWVVNVPKRELVTPLVLAYQTGRIKVGESVPPSFDEELKAFGYRANKRTGKVSYESLESKVHDDQVLAVALAYWWAENRAKMPNPLANKERSDISPEYDPKGDA